MRLSRRGLLLGGGAVLVAGGAAVGSRLRDAPDPSHPVPGGTAGQVVSGSFRSTARGATTGWSIAFPAAVTAGLPLLLVLDGRGDDHRDVLGSHRLGAFLSEAVRQGSPPFAVVGVDGGDHSYWHRRSSGEDPQAMVLDELLPLLAGRGLRTDRFALGGWSMGGYGALLLAQRLGPSRVAALALDSPALWKRWQDSAKGAFDGRADFAAHDVLAHRVGVPLRVACGTSDPFVPGVKALLAQQPAAERDLSAGGHNVAFWQHAAPGQLAFVGRHLAARPPLSG